MSTQTFLLELHCEEIPARFLQPLTDEMAGFLAAFLRDQQLASGAVERFYSPRKLAWRIPALQIHQPDQTETQVGPPQRMCLDEQGRPTQTGQKFAEKWGVDFTAVTFAQPAGKKEPCAVVTLTKTGRPSAELLAEALPRLIGSLHVPKAMRWGTSEFEFVRPIRSVLCLLGVDVVPFTVDGVASGRTTWGHRLFHQAHPGPVTLARPEDYEQALEAAGVVAGFQARLDSLAAQVNTLASGAGGRAVEDPELLRTLAEIVEFPRMLLGQFPDDFLALPKEVLVTSLREHQKSFCVEDAQGRLLPCFLTAANRPDDPEGFVKSGNEWVLRARLYDARFFFAEDRKHALAERLDKLKNLTFQRELGSYLDKTERIEALAAHLAGALGLDAEHARTAARQCKCDLRTLMVGEFPELQGVMGGEYLRMEGAPEDVWMGVKEHYQPAGAEAPIPTSDMGGALSIADKLDTVAGCFAIGLIPSGSKDPLALRRAAQGVVRILWEKGWKLDPLALAKAALTGIGTRASKAEGETIEALATFLRDRVGYQLELAGYPGAVRRAAFAAGWRDLVDLKARCEALSSFAADPRFESLAVSAKRIVNILKDEQPADAFDASALQHEAEQALAARLAHLEAAAGYQALLAALADLAEGLEAFFSAVMVKCEDPALRAARLSLLHRLRKVFLRVADFSQWQ